MKCIVADDLPIALRGMRRLIEGRSDLQLVGLYESGEEALKGIGDQEVDLAFLDIQMADMSGMELARQLGGDVMVVFTTAYSEYAVESYELDVVDYLVKPIDPERFDRAVEKAQIRLRERGRIRRELVGRGGYLTVKSERRYVRIRLEDILYVEGSRDQVVFQLVDGRIVSRATVKSLEEMLPEDSFMRVNKSYIVNLDKITAFDSNDIVIGRYEIGIGPTYKDGVLGRLLGG